MIGILPLSLVGFTIGVILLDFAVQAVHVTNQSIIFAARPEARSRLVGGYMVFYSAGSGLGAIASTTLYGHFGWPGVSVLGAVFSISALLFWLMVQIRLSRKPCAEQMP
ncbi:Major Facilitator Superfamily protein [compost metagenome]